MKYVVVETKRTFFDEKIWEETTSSRHREFLSDANREFERGIESAIKFFSKPNESVSYEFDFKLYRVRSDERDLMRHDSFSFAHEN